MKRCRYGNSWRTEQAAAMGEVMAALSSNKLVLREELQVRQEMYATLMYGRPAQSCGGGISGATVGFGAGTTENEELRKLGGGRLGGLVDNNEKKGSLFCRYCGFYGCVLVRYSGW
ncbi:hypothetical protein Vretimale_14359 [Volvox reticuliferus]|uniref:Uncharacterized protein n=1 Tax=Volvox reticuliferus TaxID=1737510 RepID=A0A8J4GM46_9CHLO|nr:hypothetical protein Vretimale_14359 [Volvox reticuliferus]